MITAIIKKELLQLRRDPRLIGLIIVMPLVLLVLFGIALKLEPKNVRMAYLDEDQSVFTNLIKTGLWSDGYFDLYPVESKKDIVEEIRAGRAKAGLSIDKIIGFKSKDIFSKNINNSSIGEIKNNFFSFSLFMAVF